MQACLLQFLPTGLHGLCFGCCFSGPLPLCSLINGPPIGVRFRETLVIRLHSEIALKPSVSPPFYPWVTATSSTMQLELQQEELFQSCLLSSPIMHVITVSILAPWPWPLTYDLDIWTWPRYSQARPACQSLSLYMGSSREWDGRTHTQTHTSMMSKLLHALQTTGVKTHCPPMYNRVAASLQYWTLE